MRLVSKSCSKYWRLSKSKE